jgi:ribosomal protein L15
LKKAEFTRLLKVQKLRETMGNQQDPEQLEKISILPAEYEKYLKLAYQAAKFSKPRTALGFAQKLPPPEMERLIHENLAVTESDLAELSSRRAQTVRERLLADGKVEPAQVFLVKAPSLAPEKKEKVRDSRVGFKLK